MPFKEKLRATLISLFENQLKAKEGMIKSNERIMKLMKEASFLKKKLRIKEKGRGEYFSEYSKLFPPQKTTSQQ